MSKRFLAAVACTLFAVAGLAADRALPQVAFSRGSVTVSGLRAGTRVAWLGMIREPRQNHSRTRIVRGFQPVTPQGAFSIDAADADRTRGLWAIADVGTGASVHARSPRAVASRRGIRVAAPAGSATIAVESGAIEVLYVRPPARAWSFAVADGGGRDADGVQNGTIVVALPSMKPLHGQSGGPSVTERGDVILVLDPRQLRTGTVEVP